MASNELFGLSILECAAKNLFMRSDVSLNECWALTLRAFGLKGDGQSYVPGW